MTSQKRLRGRPRGSGKDDLPALNKVADLLVSEPSLKPTTAMKKVMHSRESWGASEETLLRRWQVKWKKLGAELVRNAGERMRAAHQPVFGFWNREDLRLEEILRGAGAIAQAIQRLRDAITARRNSPEFQRLIDVIRFLLQEKPRISIDPHGVPRGV